MTTATNGRTDAPQFRPDNTRGYGAAQLAEMNEQFAAWQRTHPNATVEQADAVADYILNR
jgi:hypothetical protein